MPNPHEDAARLHKAVALADTLETFGISPGQAGELTAGQRLDLVTIAGVKLPSETTWAVVVETLRRRELNRARAEAAILSALPADPFEGLS